MTKVPRRTESHRSTSDARHLPPERPLIPGYHVGERLGHGGGSGTIFRAVQLAAQREVALRVLVSTDPAATGFFAGARAAAAVQHPNVVTCYDVGEAAGLHYQAFELVSGVDLNRYLQDHGGRLTAREAIGVLMACARGLEGVHRAGLVHGDITPASILIAADETVKIADLGTARLLSGGERGWDVDDATLNSTAAPEQLAGEAGDIRSDLYALGALLHLMITGRPPHVARSRTDLVRRVQGALDLRGDDVPPHLMAVMRKALAVNPSERYAVPAHLREDLERLMLDFAPIHARPAESVHLEALAPRSVPPRAPAAEARMRRGERPWWRSPLVLAACGVVVAGGVGWWVLREPTAVPAAPVAVSPAAVGSSAGASSGAVPVPATASATLPARPAWASAMGSDAYGAWADLTVAGVTQRLRWLPPATVRIGSPPDERGRHDDEGPFTATLSHGVWIADCETTQALWRVVMGDNPSHFADGGDDHPVESVNWHDVQRFLRRLSEKSGGAIAALPSEAQWEYAARADGVASVVAVAPAATRTHAVHSGAPNPWGLYGCADNVLEWCQDAYGPYPGGTATDPLGATGIARSVRGGGWSTAASDYRPALRAHYQPVMKFAFLGFRFVLNP